MSHGHSHGGKVCDGHGHGHGHGQPTGRELTGADVRGAGLQDSVHTAASLGRLERVQELVEKNGAEILKSTDQMGHTPAHWCCKNGHLHVLNYLVEAGAPVNLPSADSMGATPIHWGCIGGRLDIVHRLLLPDANVDVDVRDTQMCTPLLVAAQYGEVVLAHLLVRNGADVHAIDENHDTALAWAAYKGHASIVNLLLVEGGQLDTVDAHGQLPVHLASLRGNYDVVRLILRSLSNSAGVSTMLAVKDKKQRTPLQLAKNNRREAIVSLLSPTWWNWFTNSPDKAYFAIFFIGGYCYYPYWAYVFPATGHAVVMHIVFWALNFGKWYNLLKAHTSDPGTIKRGRRDYDDAMAEMCRSGRMEWYASRHHKLCHMCRIVRPLRSKHCRIKDTCIDRYDHYCPWVGNAVGRSNHINFFLYLLFGSFCLSLYTYMASQWLVVYGARADGAGHVVASMFLMGLFTLFLLAMLGQHAHMMLTNRTTNEYINSHRYEHFEIRDGQEFNPFDRGATQNARMYFKCEDAAVTERIDDMLGDDGESQALLRAL